MKNNIRLILLFLFVFFLATKAEASTVAFSDSTPVNKPWKISKQQFLDQYGKDDTARAIINYYFKSRRFTTIATIFTASQFVAFGTLTLFLLNSNTGIIGFFIVFIAIGLGLALAFQLPACVYLGLRFSRKRLWKDLNKYLSGNRISETFKRNLYRR